MLAQHGEKSFSNVGDYVSREKGGAAGTQGERKLRQRAVNCSGVFLCTH